MANLASMYVEVIPSVRGITGVMTKAMSPATGLARMAGRGAGSAFSGAFESGISLVSSAVSRSMQLATAAASTAVIGIGTVGIKTAAQLETANIAFTTMLGSATKASSFIADMKDFAAKTPFGFVDLTKASQSLISMGISTEKVLPIMRTLGNVTSGMGTGSEGIKRATVALQQMNAAQKISAEDLNQLRDAGIPVYDLLTAATGKTTAQIAEMREKGELGKTELDLLMKALETGAGLERFNGLMEEQAKSMAGLWATLKDTFAMGASDVMQPLVPLIKAALGGAIELTEDMVKPATALVQRFADSLTGAGGALDVLGQAWYRLRSGFTGRAIVMPGVAEMPAVVQLGQTLAWIVTVIRQLEFGWALSAARYLWDASAGARAFAMSLDLRSPVRLWESLTATLGGVGDGIGHAAGAVRALVPLMGVLLGQLARLALTVAGGALYLLGDVLGWIAGQAGVVAGVIPAIVAGFSSFGGALGSLGPAAGMLLSALSRIWVAVLGILPILDTLIVQVIGLAGAFLYLGLNKVANYLGWVADHAGTVVKIIPFLTGVIVELARWVSYTLTPLKEFAASIGFVQVSDGWGWFRDLLYSLSPALMSVQRTFLGLLPVIIAVIPPLLQTGAALAALGLQVAAVLFGVLAAHIGDIVNLTWLLVDVALTLAGVIWDLLLPVRTFINALDLSSATALWYSFTGQAGELGYWLEVIRGHLVTLTPAFVALGVAIWNLWLGLFTAVAEGLAGALGVLANNVGLVSASMSPAVFLFNLMHAALELVLPLAGFVTQALVDLVSGLFGLVQILGNPALVDSQHGLAGFVERTGMVIRNTGIVDLVRFVGESFGGMVENIRRAGTGLEAMQSDGLISGFFLSLGTAIGNGIDRLNLFYDALSRPGFELTYTTGLNNMNDAAVRLGKFIRDVQFGVGDFFQLLNDPNSVGATNGIVGAFQRAGIAAHEFVRNLDFSSWSGFWNSVMDQIGPFGDWLQSLPGSPVGKWFGDITRKAREFIGALDFTSVSGFWDSLTGNLGDAGDSLDSIMDSLIELSPAFVAFGDELGDVTGKGINFALNVMEGLLDFLVDHMDWIVDHMGLIVAGFLAWKGAVLLLNVVLAANTAISVAGNIVRWQAASAELAAATATGVHTGAVVANTGATSTGMFAQIRHTAAVIGHRIAMAASAVATGVATGAQWLFNAALNANPIGLVVVAIAALVGGLIWFFTQTEIGRAIWETAMTAIRAAIEPLWNWMRDEVFPQWKEAWDSWGAKIGEVWGIVWGAINYWWTEFISPLLDGLKLFLEGDFKGAWDKVKEAGGNMLKGIYDAALITWTTQLKPLLNEVGGTVGGETFKGEFEKTGNVGGSMLAGISAQTATVWLTTLGPKLGEIGGFLMGPFSGAFRSAEGSGSSMLGNVSMSVATFWATTLQPKLNEIGNHLMGPFAGAFNGSTTGAIASFANLGFNVGQTWEQSIRPTLSGMGAHLLGNFSGAWEGAKINAMVSWDTLKNGVAVGWQGMKDGTFGPMGQFLANDVPKFWAMATVLIGNAWDGLKEKAKAPINFVIDTVINRGIVDKFNSIRDALHIDFVPKLEHLAPLDTGGFVPGAGGMTSGMSVGKHVPTGVVHGGEMVLKKESTRKLASTIGKSGLEYMNRYGKLPGHAKGGLIRPVDGAINSGFRTPERPDHDGVDFAMPQGTPIRAAGDGTVVDAGWHAWGGGNHVDLQHEGNLRTEYYHMSKIIAKMGDKVRKGDILGEVGSTGNSTGAHLHYEVHIGDALHSDKNSVNPLDFLDGGGEYDPNASGVQAAGGGGNPFTKLIGGIRDALTAAFQENRFGSLGAGLGMETGSMVVRLLAEKAKDAWESFIGLGSDNTDRVVAGTTDLPGGLAGIATQALKRTNDYSAENLASLMRRMQQESGGNIRAINNWDSNAAAGIPSKGLMQVIDPTFQQYRDKDLPDDIYDPLANIVASINYTKARYGNLRAGWDRAGGYFSGGMVPTLFDKGGWLENTGAPQLIDHRRTQKPDAIFTNEVASALVKSATRNTEPAGNIEMTINGAGTEPEIIGEFAARRIMNRRGRR